MAQQRSNLVYLGHAFSNWYNYAGLLAAVALSLALREPGWLMIAGGLEVVYLYMLAFNPRYRRLVDSIFGDKQVLDVEAVRTQLWPDVQEVYRQRFAALSGTLARLHGSDISITQQRDPYYQDNQHKISVLLVNFLRIAVAIGRYDNYAAQDNAQTVTDGIKRLIAEADQADERVKQIKLKNIEILRQRLDKMTRAKANREYLEAQLQAIEDTLKLVVDQTLTLSDPKGIGMQVDNLLLNLKDTEMISGEMDSYLELTEGLDYPVAPIKAKQ